MFFFGANVYRIMIKSHTYLGFSLVISKRKRCLFDLTTIAENIVYFKLGPMAIRFQEF